MGNYSNIKWASNTITKFQNFLKKQKRAMRLIFAKKNLLILNP